MEAQKILDSGKVLCYNLRGRGVYTAALPCKKVCIMERTVYHDEDDPSDHFDSAGAGVFI